MTPPNPSSEAREAARTIAMRIDNLLADCNCAGGLKRQFEEYALLEVQAALDSALAASAARVKELETLMHRMIDASDKASDENPDEVREEARETLSIKVGEMK